MQTCSAGAPPQTEAALRREWAALATALDRCVADILLLQQLPVPVALPAVTQPNTQQPPLQHLANSARKYADPLPAQLLGAASSDHTPRGLGSSEPPSWHAPF